MAVSAATMQKYHCRYATHERGAPVKISEPHTVNKIDGYYGDDMKPDTVPLQKTLT